MPAVQSIAARSPQRSTQQPSNQPSRIERAKEELSAATRDVKDIFDPLNNFTNTVASAGTPGALLAAIFWPAYVVAETVEVVTKPVTASGHVLKAAAIAVGLKD